MGKTHTSQPPAQSQAATRVAGRAILAGLSASLVTIGLARFGYTPLLPPMINEHWFSAGAAALLGAANLGGYLIGALTGRAMARYTAPVYVIRLMMLVASVAFLACSFPLSQVWFFCWRFLSGVAGGAVMVLVSGVVLHHVPDDRRGLASGAIFLGIGLGVVLSGTLVPVMLTMSLQSTWQALGVLSLLLTLAAWKAWPPYQRQDTPEALATLKTGRADFAVRLLIAQYALMAVGLVPEMMFLVDYASRGLHLGAAGGATIWVAYGAGAMAGPVLYGHLADRAGPRWAAAAVLSAQILAVVALWIVSQTWVLVILAVLLGSFPSGIVPLVLAKVQRLVHGPHARQVLWIRATVAFALTQAASGYAFSWLYSAFPGHHLLLFSIGDIALVGALALGLLPSAESAASVPSPRPAPPLPTVPAALELERSYSSESQVRTTRQR